MKCSRTLGRFINLFLIAGLLAFGLRADEVNTNWRGLAIKGYDPVAYFTEGKPVEGDSDFEFEWRDATWRFASAAHRDRFAKDPEAYAPQYGGYCAWAVSQNKLAPIDPEAWRIVDGKLYLNYSPKVQRDWEQDIPGFIELADGYWPTLRKE
ncbi:YHS domain-containing (seleno)protein [Actomonas aquatica]|uniref:YHS domain-containing (seleno)protein n=1 Tax=Actomonas aquatica TaxID=2866162 RepID=UPI003CCC947C